MAHMAVPVASTIPVQLTRFVGRSRELAALAPALARARLLTLTGAGGSGKTRLALEAAGRAAAAGREVVWVELAPLEHAGRVSDRVAAALGLREAGEGARDVVDALRGRAACLVLDNCEHVLDGCAPLVATLLRALPDLTVLATSREPLGVPGETVWPVPPLAVPDAAPRPSAASLAGVDAVQLFVERAQAAYPPFRLTDENAPAVAQICRRLDGSPLALELAAARVRLLSPEQIARRLDDVFHLLGGGSRTALPRHRTLRAAIDWSYMLLNAEEQVLLDRLSVFAGDFSLEAAEAVGPGDELAAGDLLDRLGALVDKSLVLMREEPDGPRYRLLETVRQYARERLRERGAEAETLARHARWCLDFVTSLEPGLMGAFPEALVRVDAEHDNCRAALAWSLAAGRGDDLALPLAARLAWFWYYRAHYTEGLRWLHAALAAASDDPTPSRATALRATGAITSYRGDPAGALPWLERSEVLWRRLGNDRQLGFTLTSLAQVLADLGRLDEARARAAEAFALARRGEDWMMQGYVLVNAASAIALVEGDLAAAERCFIDAEPLFSQRNAFGGAIGMALSASWRAQIALWRGELDRAETLACRTLELVAPSGHHWLGTRALRVLGHLAARRGDHERAARLLGAAEARLRQLGAAVLSLERGPHEQGLADLRAQLGPQRFEACFGTGAALPFDAVMAEIRRARDSPAEPTGPAGTGGAAAAAVTEPCDAPADLALTTLGALRIERGGVEIARDAWGSSKTRELLVFLLLHPEGCTREQVGLAFWPDASTAQVRNSFHVTLHRLRKALGHPEWLVADHGRYRLAPGVRVGFDAVEFEREVTTGLRRDTGEAARRALLAAALRRYRGEFLEHEPVGDWHLEHRDRLRRLHRDGILAYGALLASAGEPAAAAQVYRDLVRRDPFCEEAYRGLMDALARSGERGEAIHLYRRLVALLAAELETEPDPATAALAARIQAGAPL